MLLGKCMQVWCYMTVWLWTMVIFIIFGGHLDHSPASESFNITVVQFYAPSPDHEDNQIDEC